jgi:hypothetical protein
MRGCVCACACVFENLTMVCPATWSLGFADAAGAEADEALAMSWYGMRWTGGEEDGRAQENSRQGKRKRKRERVPAAILNETGGI